MFDLHRAIWEAIILGAFVCKQTGTRLGIIWGKSRREADCVVIYGVRTLYTLRNLWEKPYFSHFLLAFGLLSIHWLTRSTIMRRNDYWHRWNVNIGICKGLNNKNLASGFRLLPRVHLTYNVRLQERILSCKIYCRWFSHKTRRNINIYRHLQCLRRLYIVYIE